MTRGRRTAPLSVAVVIVILVAVAVWLARGPATAHPHVLRLGSGGTQQVAAASAAPPTRDASQPYRLTGALPEGQPPDSPVWRIPRATADDASTVAAALRVDATPTRTTQGWVARSGDNLLAIHDDGSWSYGMDCAPDTPLADQSLAVGCGVAVAAPAVVNSPGAEPSPLPTPSVAPGPSESVARAVATDLMHSLGYDDVEIDVMSADPTSTVTATPSLDGTPVADWTTTMQIDGGGDVVSAYGWVGTPTRADTYPLITAQRAFDLLQQRPRPMLELCRLRTDGKPGCADIPPTEITGARLGLTLDRDNDEPVLVPAWLFDVKGEDAPLAQIAVDAAYLAQPTAPRPVPPVQGAPAKAP